MQVVEQGDTVKVHYRGRLITGKEFDASAPSEPLVFTVGDAKVIAGFSRAVLGMHPGERRRVRMMPEEAYGERNEALVFDVPRARIREDVAVGKVVQLPHDSGRTIPVVIRAIRLGTVTVDANDELAGQQLFFTITLEEIVAKGEAQSAAAS